MSFAKTEMQRHSAVPILPREQLGLRRHGRSATQVRCPFAPSGSLLTPYRQDRMMMQLQKSVKGVSDRLSQLVDHFGEWKARVDSRLPPSQNHEIMSKHASPEAPFPAPLRENDTSEWPSHVQRRERIGRVNSDLEMESPIVPHSIMTSPSGARASVSIKQELQYVPPSRQ